VTIKSVEQKQALLAELEAIDMEDITKTLDSLDNYTVTPPSSKDTAHLLALLAPILEEELNLKNSTSDKTSPFSPISKHFQLALSQTRLFSKWFVVLSILLFLFGIGLTSTLDGDTLRFLANASPLLGILTILYQFRANYNHMHELEDACPYTPAQLTAAKLLAVLGYDILLCLGATFFADCENYALWQVITHWLAPLLLTLGIALLGSFQFGISGGCLISTAAWALNLAASKDGKSIFSFLLPQTPIIYLDLLSATLGLTFLAFSLSRLSHTRLEE
jgi:hypothetical protein